MTTNRPLSAVVVAHGAVASALIDAVGRIKKAYRHMAAKPEETDVRFYHGGLLDPAR